MSHLGEETGNRNEAWRERIPELIRLAKEAQANAYAPYSHYLVGAVLLCGDGTAVKGCNIENAAYSPSVCAERTAFFKAVYEGEREFQAIAIMGGPEDIKGSDCAVCAPCGICRQVMMEFCDPETFEIFLGTPEKYEIYTLKELLPLGFGSADLQLKKA